MNAFTLWEDESFTVSTPRNPHFPYSEGPHIIISPKREIPNAWYDIELAAATFRLASKICRITENLKLASWFNIQANGNWGLLPGGTPFFHVHVYGRQKTESWGKPIVLPELPGTYQNDPMPESDRDKLANELKQQPG